MMTKLSERIRQDDVKAAPWVMAEIKALEDELRKEIANAIVDIDSLLECNNKLRKENEELKKRLIEVGITHYYRKGESNGIYQNAQTTDNVEELCKEIPYEVISNDSIEIRKLHKRIEKLEHDLKNHSHVTLGSKMNIEMIKIPNKDFEIGKYPITQKQYKEIMGINPSYFNGENNPVDWVSWDDCQEFIKRLNKLTNSCYRLPTDDEWMEALGNDYEKQDVLDIAWCYENSVNRTHPVGQKPSNEFGLYDMLGNVWEWLEDKKGETYRVLRGGSWFYDARFSRAPLRDWNYPDSRNLSYGFRLARTLILNQ